MISSLILATPSAISGIVESPRGPGMAVWESMRIHVRIELNLMILLVKVGGVGCMASGQRSAVDYPMSLRRPVWHFNFAAFTLDRIDIISGTCTHIRKLLG